MKKNYSIIFALVVNCMIGYAQPTLTQSSFSTPFTLNVYEGSIEGLSPGGSGANQTWDFSTVTNLIKTGTAGIVPTSSAPFYTEYESANYCLKITEDDTADSEYQMGLISSSSLNTLGAIYSGDSHPEDKPQEAYTFPYTFNTVNTSYEGEEHLYYTSTTTYDAYGTLKTPFGTYTNVIRQKIVESNDHNFSHTAYIWTNADPFHLIMEADFDQSYGFLTIYSDKNLSTHSNTKTSTVAVFPNPTNANLNLKLPNDLNIDKIEIIDISGKTILQENKNSKQINVQNLSNGMYFIKAYSGSAVFQSKFMKN